MPIPDYQMLMRPLLEAASKRNGDTSVLEIADEIASQFSMTPEELAQEIPSGSQKVFYNRLHWARTYLGKAGLLASPKRGRFEITSKGRSFLQSHTGPIDNAALAKFPEFQEWRTRSTATKKQDPTLPGQYSAIPSADLFHNSMSPDDRIDSGFQQIEAELQAELLSRLETVHPKQFEILVVELLERMGFGGKAGEVARPTKYSGDGGIDGVLDEDALGLDAVYVQAKRYVGNSVGRQELQAFVGAMDGERAHKGVFVTTSSFSKQAIEYAQKTTSKRIALIDGNRLAQLCMRHGIGVRERRRLILWRLDDAYFEGDA
jgi:restriction system protein